MITTAMGGEFVLWIALGLAIGFISSMPIGPINLVFATTTACGRERESRALALAVALLDGGYAFAALSATSSKLLPFSPSPVLESAASVFVMGYGVSLLVPRALSLYLPTLPQRIRGSLSGAALGLALYLANPMFAAFWLGTALALRAKFPTLFFPAGRSCFAVGASAGVSLWFAAFRRTIRDHAFPSLLLRRMTQGVGLFLFGLGAYLILKRM